MNGEMRVVKNIDDGHWTIVPSLTIYAFMHQQNHMTTDKLNTARVKTAIFKKKNLKFSLILYSPFMTQNNQFSI